jgi:hypothetical protein
VVPFSLGGRSRQKLEQKRDRDKQKEKQIFEMDGNHTSHCSRLAAQRQAKTGAGDEARTRDVLLGKEVLYH